MDFVDHYERPKSVTVEQELSFRLIKGQSELFAITSQWQELVDASGSPRPMNSPAWLLQWLRHYGADVELAIGLLYEGSRLVGLAPLCLRNYVYRVGLVFRRLQFLGVDGHERDGVASAYSGFVARQGFEATVAREFVKRIREQEFGAWHEFVLGRFDADAPTSIAMLAAIDEFGLRRAGTAIAHACIRLPGSWDAYLATLPVQKRDKLTNALAAFREWAGERGWHLDHAETTDALKEALDKIGLLNGDIWSDRVFASPRFQAFHRDYIATQSPLRGIDLAVLTVAQEVVAATYSLRCGKTLMPYHTVSSAQVPSGIRIGFVIQALMIKDAIERGDEEFDLLGNQFADELSSICNERTIQTLRVSRNCARESIRVGMSNLAKSVRELLSDSKKVAPLPPVTIGLAARADPR